ncbi:MAG: hypothetical protein J6583_13990 [Gilliamella sp.]|nr:hypothetical protein [Gilliamella sp.]
MGNVWKYGYDNNGKLNSKTKPDGGVTKIDYVLSVPTRRMAMSSLREQSWKINSNAFGNSELDANNQITMNLRFSGPYYDAETGLSYNYFRDYNVKTEWYIQSDPS